MLTGGSATLNSNASTPLSRNTTLGMSLDPARWSPDPPFRITLIELGDVPLNNGPMLIVHVLRDIIIAWRSVMNPVIKCDLRYSDSSTDLTTLIEPLPQASRQIDYRTLGYIYEDISAELLRMPGWTSGYWVRVFRRDVASVDEMMRIYVLPSSRLNSLSSNLTNPKQSLMETGGSSLSSALTFRVSYTGTQLTYKTVCYLFGKALPQIVVREPRSFIPFSWNEQYTLTVETPDLDLMLHVSVPKPRPPLGHLYASELADGLLQILHLFARKDRWETARATIFRQGIPMATVELLEYLGGSDITEGGKQNQTAIE